MGQAVLIRPVDRADAAIWERMRTELWPDGAATHASDIARYFAGGMTDPLEVLVACLGSGSPLGFIELSIRPYAEGCTSERVAFVEGWYVGSDHREHGIGTALMRAAEEWGRAKKCTELASDTPITNEVSVAAHRALGFDETARIVCFRKAL